MRLAHAKGKTEASNDLHKPLFFRLNNIGEREKFNEFLDRENVVFVHDDIENQVRELIKIRHPNRKFSEDEYNQHIAAHLSGMDAQDYGVWVYYPWACRLVHLLDEAEFTEVRTSRNQHKITQEEQSRLAGKKIGIVGLSVGQSIALTLAMERVCGELRLADFDTAELSNLNRIRTGVQNLGVKKVVLAAREIAEIDPFLQVKIFGEGLQEHNIDDFFSGGGNLDILVEVCDGLDMKIISRFKAREMRIPVVMDTNDRGMVDVERFDLEPSREILHGYAGTLNPENIKTITEPERLSYILKMVGAATLSPRMKASMLELNQTISTWPQLASSVVLGGAVTTDVCRRILLDQFHDSGRYYIDIDHIIGDKKTDTAPIHFNTDLLIPAASHRPVPLPAGSVQFAETYVQELINYAQEQNVIFKRFPFVFKWQEDRLAVFAQVHDVPYNMHFCILGAAIASFNHKLQVDGKDFHASVIHTDAENGAYEVAFLPGVAIMGKGKDAPVADYLEENGIYTSWAADKDAAADLLARTERLLHFAPETHRLQYNYISFSPDQPGTPYEHMGMPLMAKPVYLMASDPDAITYTGNWDKGMALYYLAKMRMAQAGRIGIVEADIEDHDLLIRMGMVFQSLVWESNSDRISINDTVLGLYKIKDFPEIYRENRLLTEESFNTIFNTNMKRGVFIVLV